MSKVKNMAWDNAEEQSDKIINNYCIGAIDEATATKQLKDVDNLSLCGIDETNIDEVLDIAKQEYGAKLLYKNEYLR
jgi:hypothetical protein